MLLPLDCSHCPNNNCLSTPPGAPLASCSIPDPLFRGVKIQGHWLMTHTARCGPPSAA